MQITIDSTDFSTENLKKVLMFLHDIFEGQGLCVDDNDDALKPMVKTESDGWVEQGFEEVPQDTVESTSQASVAHEDIPEPPKTVDADEFVIGKDGIPHDKRIHTHSRYILKTGDRAGSYRYRNNVDSNKVREVEAELTKAKPVDLTPQPNKPGPTDDVLEDGAETFTTKDFDNPHSGHGAEIQPTTVTSHTRQRTSEDVEALGAKITLASLIQTTSSMVKAGEAPGDLVKLITEYLDIKDILEISDNPVLCGKVLKVWNQVLDILDTVGIARNVMLEGRFTKDIVPSLSGDLLDDDGE